MATLLNEDTGTEHVIPARCIIGRHPTCSLIVDHPRISGQHACLQWTGEHWEVRDLGSRNGTMVEGRSLASGERVRMFKGSWLTLGGLDTVWRLGDAAAPTPCARAQSTGQWHAGEPSLLVLPDRDTAKVTVFQNQRGHWMLESPDDSYPVRSGQAVTIDGQVWILDLPLSLPATWVDEESREPTLADLELCFQVSRDEEHIKLSFAHGRKVIEIPPRAYSYMLLTLARERLSQADFSEAERGWVHREDLCRMLAVDHNKLNVHIYRLRRDLAGRDVVGGGDIIERRAGTGELRIGIDRLRIVSL